MAVTRHQALAAVRSGQEQVDRLVARLGERDVGRRATLGGGDWSVRDLIGHLASWEQRALDAIDAWREQRPMQVLIGVRGVDELNDRNVQAWRAKRPSRARADAAEIHGRLLAALAGLGDRDWRSTMALSNGTRRRLSTILGGTLGGPAGPFRHAEAHLPDLEAFVASTRSSAGTRS